MAQLQTSGSLNNLLFAELILILSGKVCSHYYYAVEE